MDGRDVESGSWMYPDQPPAFTATPKHSSSPFEVVDSEEDTRDTMKKVSTLVILRRIHDAGGLTREMFWEEYNSELTRLSTIAKGSGGDFYLTLGARASKRFARALVASTMEGRSSFTEAFRLLGFKKMATFRELGQSLGLVF